MTGPDETLVQMKQMLFVCDTALRDGGYWTKTDSGERVFREASEGQLLALGNRRDNHEKAIKRWERAA